MMVEGQYFYVSGKDEDLQLQNFDDIKMESGALLDLVFQIADEDQLKHFKTGKFVHPFHGRKRDGAKLCLRDGFDGDRTCCYPFEFNGSSCLIGGGDSYFVEPFGTALYWFKYYNAKDTKSPFTDCHYKFEFIPLNSAVSTRIILFSWSLF